jgi:hypothetical protein
LQSDAVFWQHGRFHFYHLRCNILAIDGSHKAACIVQGVEVTAREAIRTGNPSTIG